MLAVLPVDAIVKTSRVRLTGEPVRHAEGFADSFQRVHFGAYPLYEGPYDALYFSNDFNDKTSYMEAITCFHDVLRYTQEKRKRHETIENFPWLAGIDQSASEKGLLLQEESTDIPFGNVDYIGLSNMRLAGPRRIAVHVTDRGVGNGDLKDGKQNHDRSILVTQNHGILIGPNNGSLGLLISRLKHTKEPFKLYPIDIEKVQTFERLRRQDLNYRIPETFHGRDLFSVVAAAIAGGIEPTAFADFSRINQFEPKSSKLADNIRPLPQKVGDEAVFVGIQDRTCGNVKTSLTIPTEAFEQLFRENAVFEVRPEEDKHHPPLPFKLPRILDIVFSALYNLAHSLWQTLKQLFGFDKIQIPLKKAFSQVSVGDPLIYLGSSYSPDGKSRFIEIALNEYSASQKLGIPPFHAKAFRIKRIR